VAERPLKCTGADLQTGRETPVSVRQHSISVLDREPASDMGNVLPGTIVRHVFLGSSRDYLVALKDGTELRVTAPPSQRLDSGAGVWLHIPAEECRALMG
jgi:iron(III) transport system ATP-binding protein